MNRVAAISGLALFAAGLVATPIRAQTPELRPDDREPITIPFELLDSGHMAIRVKLDGKGPFRVIFDTGAPTVAFSGRAAREAGLIPEGSRGGLVGSYRAKAKPTTVEVGDYRRTRLVPTVMDHPTVESLASALGPIDGLVGFDLFAPDRLTIDYRARTITVLPGKDRRTPNPQEAAEEMGRALLGPAKAHYVAPAALWGLTVTKAKGDTKPGVDVAEVRPGSAAAEAGLAAGDRLLVVSHRWADSVEDVYRTAGLVWAGKAVGLTVRRGEADLELTLEPRAGL